MSQLSFYSTLSQSASDQDYVGIFGTTASPDGDLMGLSRQGSQIVTWCRLRMGQPVVTVQLKNNQLFACFQEANIQYSRLVNTHQVQMWFLNVMGQSANGDYTGQVGKPNLDFIKQAAKYYSQQSKPIVGGKVKRRKGYFDTDTSSVLRADTYNFMTDSIDTQSGSALTAIISQQVGQSVSFNMQKWAKVTEVYYYPSTTVNKYWDVYSISNNFFPSHRLMQNWRYRLRPVFETILNAQQLQQHQFVRQANYNFNIVGDQIKISPPPSMASRIHFDYIIYDRPIDSATADLKQIGKDHDITSIWDVPYKNIPYEALNSISKRWIRQFTLALRKQTLGLIRRKFSTIKIPNEAVTLDGGRLVGEGLSKQQELRDQLRVHLQKLNLQRASDRDAQLSQNVNRQLKQIPMGIFVG